MKTHTFLSFFLLMVWGITLVLGFFVAVHRYKNLAVGNIDYSYFLGFTGHAFESKLDNTQPINPIADGHNMFFLTGPDGAPTLWHWVHTEVIKIIPTLLYSVTHTLLAAYAFYIVLFFLPLGYGTYIVWRRCEMPTQLTLALTLLAVYPSSFLYATGELRPFLVLPSLFVCFVCSLIYRRPLFEKMFFLTALLLVREEALILAGAALLWELLRNERTGEAQKNTYTLTLVTLVWGAATACYYLFSGYGIQLPIRASILLPLLAVSIFGFGYLVWWAWSKKTHMWAYAPDVFFAWVALVPITFSLITIEPIHSPLRVVYGRYGFILFYVLIAVSLSFLYSHRHALLKNSFSVACTLLCLLFVASELVPHASATRAYVARWDAALPQTELVYTMAASIPRDTPTLLDTTTIVAFFNHNNVYAYNFLPYNTVGTNEGRTFPENRATLNSLIKRGNFAYAVLLTADAQPVVDELQKAGRHVTLSQYNETFSVYTIK